MILGGAFWKLILGSMLKNQLLPDIPIEQMKLFCKGIFEIVSEVSAHYWTILEVWSDVSSIHYRMLPISWI